MRGFLGRAASAVRNFFGGRRASSAGRSRSSGS